MLSQLPIGEAVAHPRRLCKNRRHRHKTHKRHALGPGVGVVGTGGPERAVLESLRGLGGPWQGPLAAAGKNHTTL